MRFPSSPGYGARSSPSASAPSKTQVTFLPICALCRHEPVAEKYGDGRRHADLERRAGPAPAPIVAIHDSRRSRSELEQARREVEVEVCERVLHGLELALGRDDGAERSEER